MEFHHLRYEKSNHIATITLHNPAKLNAMSGRMLECFSHATEQARKDDDVRVVILTGEGRGFCTGIDTEVLIALAQGKPATCASSPPTP
jgi:enoyl-CoA hydratase/carnithine racemase